MAYCFGAANAVNTVKRHPKRHKDRTRTLAKAYESTKTPVPPPTLRASPVLSAHRYEGKSFVTGDLSIADLAVCCLVSMIAGGDWDYVRARGDVRRSFGDARRRIAT